MAARLLHGPDAFDHIDRRLQRDEVGLTLGYSEWDNDASLVLLLPDMFFVLGGLTKQCLMSFEAAAVLFSLVFPIRWHLGKI